jgi:hypothetical protein
MTHVRGSIGRYAQNGSANGWLGLTLLGVLKRGSIVDSCGMRLKLRQLGDLCVRSRMLREESGIALVMALAVMLVLTILLTSVIFLTSSSARDAQHTNAGQKAYSLAEAGINNALAVLNQNYPGTAKYPGDSTLLPSRTTSYSTGTVTWAGTLGIAPAGAGWGAQWTLTSTGDVPNPTGPGTSDVTRKVTAVVPVVIPAVTPIGANNPLNYIYSFKNLTFPNSVKVASPIYANGDLVLSNSSAISEFIGGNNPSTPNRLAVKGNLWEIQGADTVGHVWGTTDPTYDIGEAYIEGQCTTKSHDTNPNTANLHPCVWSDSGVVGPTDQLWAKVHGSVVPSSFLDYTPQLTCCAPFPDDLVHLAPKEATTGWSNMGSAYISADLGPKSPCTGGSVPFTFDGVGGEDDQINNSATPAGSSPIDLTPSNSDYDCTSRAGEISWNHTSGKFHVQGEVFIDGSAQITAAPSVQATVTGQGSIFLTGTFSMKNALMCVKTTGNGNNTSCDTTPGAWDPNTGALIIVADGDGGFDSTQAQSNVVPTGAGIDLKGSSFQGGLIASKDINVETTSQMQGPMISIYNDVTAGQSNILTFPPLQFAPGGGGNFGPTPTPQLLSPRQFTGG